MKDVNYLINEIKGLDGATVEIFGQQKTLKSIEDDAIINVCDFLENLKGYECDNWISVYNEETDDYEEKLIEDNSEFIDFVINEYGAKEITCDNTFNYMSPIDHDINFYVYECAELDKVFVELDVHKYGDIRSNYTDTVLLEFDSVGEFEECFYNNENSYKFVSFNLNDKEYYISLNMWSDCKEISDKDGNYLFSSCGTDLQDIIEDVKSKLEEEEEQ